MAKSRTLRNTEALSTKYLVDSKEASRQHKEKEKEELECNTSSSESEELIKPTPAKKKRAAPKKKTREEQDDESSTTDDASSSKNNNNKIVCPHCSKQFTKNFVCRPSLRPGGPVQKGKRKEDASTQSGKKYKRFRGAKQDRICPLCNREFTSILGLNYHVSNKVCAQQRNKNKPFGTLQPGEQFCTRFGVVEVIADNRAQPVADYPPKLKDLQ